MNLNLNEIPEAIYAAKDGDMFFLDNHRMEFNIDESGPVYLSAYDPEREFYYSWIHVRSTDGRATFGRRDLVELIRTKSYVVQ